TEERVLPTLPGSAGPVRVHRVHGRSALRTRFDAHRQRGLLPFVGRQAERLALQGRLGAVAAGGGPEMVALEGAPGVGKTRLAHEFLAEAEARGLRVLRGHCSAGLDAEPLQPLLEALGQGPGMLPPALRGLRPETWRGALQQQLQAAVAAPATVLFIDDWQWVDDATRQAVHALLAMNGLPLLMLVTTRPQAPDDAPLQPVATLALGPLADDEAEGAVQAGLPSADPFLRREICRLSGGNPLYIEELCHQARHAPAQLAGLAGAGVPPAADALWPGGSWLRTLIDARVARLTPRARDVLAAAAVLGAQAPARQLRQIMAQQPDEAALATLAR
ncbi:MAG: AAA family ATPase, partial [Rubrivivax sp.]